MELGLPVPVTLGIYPMFRCSEDISAEELLPRFLPLDIISGIYIGKYSFFSRIPKSRAFERARLWEILILRFFFGNSDNVLSFSYKIGKTVMQKFSIHLSSWSSATCNATASSISPSLAPDHHRRGVKSAFSPG
jgi:hypothetical protein